MISTTFSQNMHKILSTITHLFSPQSLNKIPSTYTLNSYISTQNPSIKFQQNHTSILTGKKLTSISVENTHQFQLKTHINFSRKHTSISSRNTHEILSKIHINLATTHTTHVVTTPLKQFNMPLHLLFFSSF